MYGHEVLLASLKQAHAAFEAQTGGEPAPLWIDYTIGGLQLHDGKMHMHLAHHEEAIASFKKVASVYAHDASTPFATRIEVRINQIIAEVSRKDQTPKMDWCVESWEKSLNDARLLGSRSKENKVIQVYNTMLRVWSREREVIDLREIHFPSKKRS